MFTLRIIIKMTNKKSLFVFSADDSQNSVTVWAKYLNLPERCYSPPL